jgi:D-arabinose 1-dehydrogenase-like Zn-dependent alcohol dehydrogenase/uncharacterized protein (UPF0276 family)
MTLVGVSLLPADDLREATAPLFEAGLVEAVEWNLDFGWGPDGIPPWIESILDAFEARAALFAHGVELSPMSARFTDRQEQWLGDLARTARARRFRHVTEHYGFITAGPWVRGTPLPLPPSRAALEIVRGRIARMEDACGAAVGIENLGFAFGRRDALAQATFIGELCAATSAFVLLDVHNLFCQAHNFDLDALALAEAYPLERVREIHVAGGSWWRPACDPTRPFRRDTHDDAVPGWAFSLLEHLLPRCPNLDAVILERTDRSLFGVEERERYRADYERILRTVRRFASGGADGPPTPRRRVDAVDLVADDEPALDRYQRTLLDVLAQEHDPASARERIGAAVAAYAPHVGDFELPAVELGAAMVREWVAEDEPAGTMHAVVLTRPGAPLALLNLPIPEPGPGQVLLRVEAVGLCGLDAHARTGVIPVPTPIVLGHEVAGVVEAAGDGVATLAAGDRVAVGWTQAGCGACEDCARGAPQRCADARTWIENGGGLSELAIVEAAGCLRLPDGLAPKEAAPLVCAGAAAFAALRRAGVEPGDRVAVVGFGGVGHLAVQIACALGHAPLVVTSTAEKARDAAQLGARRAVLGEGDPGAALERAGLVDVVIAATSSMPEAGRAARGLAPRGRIVLVGIGEGTLDLDPIALLEREATVLAVQPGPDDAAGALALAAEGRIRPRVEAFPFHLAYRALRRIEEGRVRYRAVVVPS